MIGLESDDKSELLPYKNTHNKIVEIPGFERIGFNFEHFPPIEIVRKSKIAILKRRAKKKIEH